MLENYMLKILPVLAIIFLVVIVGICIFLIISNFSPKLKGKMMSKQIKTLKHTFDYSKGYLEDIGTTMGEIAINTRKNIINNNDEELQEIMKKSSDLSSIAVEKTARAVKKGFQNEGTYCKHCGKNIDSDSNFCKVCGKEL